MSTAIRVRMFKIMRRELDFSQLQLTPYSRQQIESLIGYGMTRMQANKALDNPGLIMRAEQNLKGLIEYFVTYAKKIGTFPALGDLDFDDALRHTPPFWPFCASG